VLGARIGTDTDRSEYSGFRLSAVSVTPPTLHTRASQALLVTGQTDCPTKATLFRELGGIVRFAELCNCSQHMLQRELLGHKHVSFILLLLNVLLLDLSLTGSST
jgi:hypothetical protein